MSTISLNANLFLILIALVVSIGIALVSYHRVFLPDGSKRLIFLFVLRAIAIFVAFLLISEPILTFILKSTKAPSVAILIDNSKSMGIKDRLGDRKTLAKEIADKLTRVEIQGDKKFFIFSRDAEEKKNFNPESLSFSGGLTNISEALKKVQGIASQENIKAIVLVSDGVYNSGENPSYFSERLGIPVFTIGVGDSNVQKDLKVVDVLTNEIAYAGLETPVVVRMESSELGGNDVIVTLHDEKGEVAREKVSLKDGINEYIVNFKFIPKEEGLKKFTVKVQQLPDEITYQNNQKSFYIKVLKGKHKILLISGAPSPDLAFIKRVIVESKNYEVISYTEKRGKEFIEGGFDFKNAETADAIIFVGYPVKTSDIDIINRLKSVIMSQNKPFLFVISRTIEINKLRAFSEILPFRFSRISGDEEVVNLVITEDGKNHAVMDLKDKNYIWNILPPIFKLRGGFSPSAGSTVLAKAKYQNVEADEPLIIVNQLDGRKSAAILCYGIWRWKLMAAPNKEFEGVFESFINNLIRWLVAPVEEEFIKFKISKNFFVEDEKIEFTAQIYAEDYSPVNDAEVKVKILTQGDEEIAREVRLERITPGVYSGNVYLPKGDYKYEADISRKGKTLKNFVGRFTVGEIEIEFLNTRMDSKLLREIASKTGGVFLSKDEISALSKLIPTIPDFKSALVEKKKEYILWSRFEPLVIVIVLLSIEWFLRKRSGLV